MSQQTPIIGANQSGIDYRTQDNAGKTALMDHHKGATAPTYAAAGIIWIDDVATPWLMKVYDGTDWIVVASINATTNAIQMYNGTASLRLLNHAADTGLADAYVIAPAPAITAYTTGQLITLKPINANTGASTVNVNSLGVKSIKTIAGADPAAGVLATTGVYILMYDGTNFVLLNAIASIPNGSVTNSMLATPTSTTYSGTAGGTANAVTLTPTPALAAYFAGDLRTFKVGATNTSGTVTVAVSGLATRNVMKFIGGGVVSLAVGDLIINTEAIMIDDGTQYLLLNPATYSQGADVASATTTNLDTATGDYVNITGTTAITGITLSQGRQTTVKFAGILTLTNGASLIIPGSANITTAAGDIAVLRGEASGVVRVVSYTKADGTGLVAAGGSTLVLLSTATASASSSLAFTSLISSSYDAYFFVFRDLLHSAAGTLDFAISTNNGSTWTGYTIQSQKEYLTLASTTAPTYASGGAAQIALTTATASAETYNGSFELLRPASTVARGVNVESRINISTSPRMEKTSGVVVESAVNAIRFLPSTGTFTSGSILMYGVKNT